MAKRRVRRNSVLEAGQADASPSDYSFFMTVDEAFEIEGRGTVVVGKIGKGELRPQDLISFTEHTQGQYAVAIEVFREQKEGMNFCVLIKGLRKADIKIGSAIVK
ncbi:MAG: hypothetical protein LBE56_04610 [Tannerella sp.]|jgi:elongation factor Tu|nr:hypothetical protein [Tannerella sp.]